MCDESCCFDHQIILVDSPFYSVRELFSQLGYVIHPPADVYGRQLSASSTEHDDKEHIRVKYLEYLTDRLIEAIEQERVVIKSESEMVIAPPVKREQLNNARLYKSQIVLFLRALRVKVIFKAIAAMLVQKKVGDREMLKFVHADKYLISHDEEGYKGSLSDQRSPHSLSEVEQNNQIKPLIADEDRNEVCTEDSSETQHMHSSEDAQATRQTDQPVLANYKELANAFEVVPGNEYRNLQWFRTRCSDVRKYPAFSLARKESYGKGGKAAKFDVLVIAAHLSDKGFIYQKTLKRAIDSHFKAASERFENLLNPTEFKNTQKITVLRKP
jgi:hypothetical protein